MSTLGLPSPSTFPILIPHRIQTMVPDQMERIVGRKGLNIYRMIDGNRTIQEIARLMHTSDKEVVEVMRAFQDAGYVTLEVSKTMSIEERLACIPTLIMEQSGLGLTYR